MNMIQDILNKFTPMLSKHGIKLSVENTPEAAPAKVEMMAEETLEDGTKVYTPAPEMAEGVEVYTMDSEGNHTTPVADGEYKLANGTTIVVAEGKIASMQPMKEEAKKDEEEVVEVEQVVAETYSKEQVEGLLKNVISEFEAKLSAAEKKITELSKAPAATTVKQARQATPQAPLNITAMSNIEDRTRAIVARYKNN